MKGVVFREFLEFADAQFGETATEALIEECNPESGGAYVSTGYYPFEELTDLLDAARRRSGACPQSLLESFGGSLARSFTQSHARYFDEAKDLFDLLDRVDRHIHVEVRRLYPDAELPSFETVSRDETQMALDYSSPRKLQSLAKGLIETAARHYGEEVAVTLEPYPDADERTARITVRRVAS